MIKSKHVSHDDLLEMLNGEGETEKTRAIGVHLHQCGDCRSALDALTAQSEIWDKTPELLKDKRMSDSFSNSGSHIPGTVDRHRDRLNDNEQEAWQFPIDNLLDTPKHPEMMGRIGNYDIECEVGRGGMGVVLKAHDAELNRPVAIKILSPHLASHGTARKRFAQEARAAAGVLHPNVIAVHCVNNEGKTPFIVMPYVAGPSLQTLVDEQGPLAEIEIVRIALQISAGLAAAHSQGLVHRDIKPANILVESDVSRVLITDFGLARAEDDASMTRTGWLAGTPNYMSPEQTRGERPDQRSDLFSLGSLIYFLATGRLPFRSESPLGVLNRIQNDEPTPVRQVNHQISKTLSDVIELLLEKELSRRCQSSADLHGLLEKHLVYLHQPDISKPPRVKRAEPRGSRNKLVKLIIGVAIATSLSLSALVYSGMVTWPALNGFYIPLPENGVYFPFSDVGESQGSPSTTNRLDVENSTLLTGSRETGSDADSLPSGSDPPNDDTELNLASDNDRDGAQSFADAITMFDEGKIDDAIVAFQIAADFDEYKVDSIYNIGCCWAANGDKDKAFESLNRAVELGYCDIGNYRGDDDLASLRGDERFNTLGFRIQGNQDAIEFVNEAIEQAGGQRYEKADELCRQALKLNPNLERAELYLGYTLHMQGKLDEATKWHKRAAASKLYAGLGNYNLCCVQSLRDDPDQAFDYLTKAIKSGLSLAPDFINEDSDLDNIRSDARYALAIEKLEKSWGRRSEKNGMRFSKSYGTFLISSSDTDLLPQDLYSSDQVKGTWEGEFENRNLDLAILRGVPGTKWRWGFSTDYKLTDFTPEVSEASTQFELKRKYGGIKFEGSFSDGRGEGSFQFEGSDSYRSFLGEKGIEHVPDALLFRFFFAWHDEDAVIANLQELQQLGLDQKTLQVLMIDGVDADLVRRYQKAGLGISDHLTFLIWRVRPKLLIEYNNVQLNLQEHKGYINKRVPASLLVAYKSAGLDLKAHDKFINWRVEPKLLQTYLAAGLALQEHSNYINKRVPAALLKAYSDAGFDLDQHEKYIEGRVEAGFLKRYQNANLALEEYEEFIQNRVPASLLLKYKDAGYDPLKFKHFIKQRITPEFIKKYEAAGLDIEEHKAFIKRRTEPAEVLKYRQRRSNEN